MNPNELGIIVIGRNEALRLDPCLAALAAWREQTVYIDSGSRDRSPEIAEGHGLHVVRLTTGPFSAARGRQVGMEELYRRRPNVRYVQFVDGDCIVEPGWIETACTFLDQHPTAAVVVGQLCERQAGSSLLLRLADVDWDLPIGSIDAIGGIAMIRRVALDQVNGWRSDLVAGEELDLSARLRAAGWELFRLDQPMTVHDMGLTTVGEFWRRAVRSGLSYAQLAVLHGRTRCRRWLRRAIGNVAYGMILPLLLAVFLVTWPPGAILIGAFYTVFLLRIVHARTRRGDSVSFAALYALVILACKFAGAIGTVKYLYHTLRGKQIPLVEYKAPA